MQYLGFPWKPCIYWIKKKRKHFKLQLSWIQKNAYVIHILNGMFQLCSVWFSACVCTHECMCVFSQLTASILL